MRYSRARPRQYFRIRAIREPWIRGARAMHDNAASRVSRRATTSFYVRFCASVSFSLANDGVKTVIGRGEGTEPTSF